MTVEELIERLKQEDPKLPVTVADWAEDYADDDEAQAESIIVSDGAYWPKGENGRRGCTRGPHLVIGALVTGSSNP